MAARVLVRRRQRLVAQTEALRERSRGLALRMKAIGNRADVESESAT
eukprot:COSAG06_NODE_45183_length_357_cov_0.589147_1_plen_46_part_10